MYYDNYGYITNRYIRSQYNVFIVFHRRPYEKDRTQP
jgi:hypothetical protein